MRRLNRQRGSDGRGGQLLSAALVVLLSQSSGRSAAADWPQYAGNARRDAAAVAGGPTNVRALLWNATLDDRGQPLRLETSSSPVTHGGRIYANARFFTGPTYTDNRIVALDQATGACLFTTLIDRGVVDSWSSPAVDAANNLVLIGSGSSLFAVDASAGGVAWASPLNRAIVNASPVVADDQPYGRAFITDYDPFGGDGRLYCVNTSPFDAGQNPHQPGEILWEEPIGQTSGSTPAYNAGIVYVATRSAAGGFPEVGTVHAFSVSAPAGSRLLWATSIEDGYFGGLAYVDGCLYAASYDFFGSGDNSTLVKLRASDGAILWTVPCERSASIPVVRSNRIYLSAGLSGFGSAPRVQAFRDDGASAVKLWDTHADTGGALAAGSWTHQPVLIGDRLLVGRLAPGAFFGPYSDLLLLDVTRTPVDPQFVVEQHAGAGGSPAVAGGRVYCIGPGGMHALAAFGDFTGDGIADGDDIQGYVSARMSGSPSPQQIALADQDGNALLNAADDAMFAQKLLMP